VAQSGGRALLARLVFGQTTATLAAALLATSTLAEVKGPPKAGKSQSVKPAITYSPMSFAQLSGWEGDDHLAAFKAFSKSCARLVGARERTGSDKALTSEALLSACGEALKIARPNKASARVFFEHNFTPNALAHAGPEGLVTGYYEPLLEGSRTEQGAFRTPVYKRPPDLLTLVEETQRAGAAVSHGRKTESGVEAYATRAQIDQGYLKGRNLELLFVADPVDVFFMQIQGSGRVKLTDGSIVRVHYDGKNGHPYTSIGRYLIEKGLLAADKVSMGALSKWLRADPERGRQVMWQNASYVFFRELKGDDAKGPLGAMNTILTPGRSIAIDPAHHALGVPIWVDGSGMTHVHKGGTFHRLMVAQDVGSAIKGPERGDIFFGSGEAAGRLAGVTKHPCKFYVLLPNEPAVRAARGEAPAGKAQ